MTGQDHARAGESLSFETFEHQADIGVRGFGSTREEAFANAGRALFSVMVDIDAVLPETERIVSAEAPDSELLFVEWLNALLSLAALERMVFSRFIVTIEGTKLRGRVWGEALDQERHAPSIEVKAATYHQLRVELVGKRYLAQCVVDV